jgi:hypothetical protein
MRTYLRIAASVIGLVCCVMFVAFWIRSGQVEDRASGYVAGFGGFRVYSSRGCLVCCTNTAASAVQSYPWALDVGSNFWLDADDDRITAVPAFSTGAGFTYLSLPYWNLFIVATIATVLTGTRCHFSVRALLLVMTVIAVLLGALTGWQ